MSEMSAAEALYGGPDDAAAPSSHATPAQVAQRELAGRMYDRVPTPIERSGEGDAAVLFDGPDTIDEAAQSLASEAADQGRILPDQVEPMGKQLTVELGALGINERSERDALMRDLRRPAPEGKAAQLAQGATLRELHSRYGEKYQTLLAETNAWLRRTAPVIATAMGRSRVGNDVRYVPTLVDAYVRSKRVK